MIASPAFPVPVILAKAGIQRTLVPVSDAAWTPAFAAVTVGRR